MLPFASCSSLVVSTISYVPLLDFFLSYYSVLSFFTLSFLCPIPTVYLISIVSVCISLEFKFSSSVYPLFQLCLWLDRTSLSSSLSLIIIFLPINKSLNRTLNLRLQSLIFLSLFNKMER